MKMLLTYKHDKFCNRLVWRQPTAETDQHAQLKEVRETHVSQCFSYPSLNQLPCKQIEALRSS